MIEGTTGEMTLADEREDTVTHFVQWAYTGDYPDPPPPPDPNPPPDSEASSDPDPPSDFEAPSDHNPPSDSNLPPTDPNSSLVESKDNDDRFRVLMVHAMLYVFADRFNIQALKEKTFGKLTARIVAIGVPSTREDKLAVIYLITYAFKNLPKCILQDKLLEYLGLYASCSLEDLREEPEFFELVENDVDFMKELFMHVRKGNKTPWGTRTMERAQKLVQRCMECGMDYKVKIPREDCRYCHFPCQTLFGGEPILIL